MNIPNFDLTEFTDKDGRLTPRAYGIFSQLFQELQGNASNEGLKIPQQTTANINILNTQQSNTSLLYDSQTNQPKINVNGTFKIIPVVAPPQSGLPQNDQIAVWQDSGSLVGSNTQLDPTTGFMTIGGLTVTNLSTSQPVLTDANSQLISGQINLALPSHVTGILGPLNGGLGISNPTAHGILVGEGASAVNPIVLGAGQLLIGTTSSDPVAATLTQGSGVTITSASGSITISATGSGGTVTSLTAGTGITLTPSTITTTGSIALTVPVAVINGGTGTSTPALVAGTGISITGSWPNQTITANGGNMVAGTNISISGNTINVINNPTFSGLVTASAGLTVSGTTNINTSGSSAINIATNTYTGTFNIGNTGCTVNVNSALIFPTNPTPAAGGTVIYNKSGIGFTVQSPQFQVVANGTLGFSVNTSQQVATKNNTLDNGSTGAAIFAGSVTLPGNAASALQAVPLQQLQNAANSSNFYSHTYCGGF